MSVAVDKSIVAEAIMNFMRVESMVYIKPFKEQGWEGYSAHCADGSRIGIISSQEEAEACLMQHNIKPVQIH